MREIILGTAGHVDHGKTSLVRALTGIDTDRLKEEKERGITIELGFAFLDLPCGHRLGIVDVPGHEKFVKNMVAGATGMDLVAFIIAADEGIMPQTREHFDICRLLGINRGLVVITKKDMVDPEWLAMVKEDINKFFAGSFLEGAPMLAVSSTTGDGLAELHRKLDEIVAATAFSEAHGPFRLPIDRVFTMKGFGVVVTGTSISGRIGTGDDIVIYPRKLSGRIRGIQVHAADVETVEAGHRTAINIQGIEKELIRRGDVVATPDCVQPSYLLDADFHYLAGNKKPFRNRTRVRVHLGTAEIMGRIVLLDDEEIAHDTIANVQILLEEPAGIWPGDHYVIRSYSPVTTIGGGVILNGSPRKRRRVREIDRENNRQVFEIYHANDPEKTAMLHIRESGYNGLTFDRLAVKTGLFGNRLKKILAAPVSARRLLVIEPEKQRMLEAGVYEKLCGQIQVILAGFHRANPMHPGLSKEELRSKIYRGLDQRLFQFVLNDLARQEKIVLDKAIIRLAGHEVSLQDDGRNLKLDLAAFYLATGLAVPTMKEVLARFAGRYSLVLIKEVLNMMVREGLLVKISEELYFHAEPLAGLEKNIIGFLHKKGEIDAPGFKTLTGLSRKFAIPLLEYLDKRKVTIRVGDKRILREKR